MVQWTKLLKNIGLTESETKTYITALEAGPASVQDLARKARISRVTTYAAIETLLKEGLISTVQKGKKTLYAAESPDRLMSVAQARAKRMEGIIHEIEHHINELRLVQRGEKPVVRIFEGPEALKSIQDDVLRSRPQFIDELADLDAIDTVYDRAELQPYLQELAKRNIKQRAIRSRKTESPFKPLPNALAFTLPPSMADFFGDIMIYGNKVALSTFRGKQISVLVESEDLAKTMRLLFTLAWQARNGGVNHG